MVRRCVGSSGAERLLAKTSLLVSSWSSDEPTLPLTMASVHPVLKASSWRVSIMIQMERRIDRRCHYSDRRIIRCYYPLHFCSFQSCDDATRKETGGSSDGVNFILAFCAVYKCTDVCNDGTVGSSDDDFYCFLRVFNLPLLQLNILNLSSLIASKYILSPHFLLWTCWHAWYVNLWYDILTWSWYVNSWYDMLTCGNIYGT
jgi:hypothetical protein